MYMSFTVNVPLAGGTEGADSTLSESTCVAVVVVDVCVVAVVVVVLVAISMLKVALAKRAAEDESPTGKAYMYTRGDVTLHMSLKPSVENCTSIVPLCAGRTTLKLSLIGTVAPVVSDVARRNARSWAVPASSTVAY